MELSGSVEQALNGGDGCVGLMEMLPAVPGEVTVLHSHQPTGLWLSVQAQSEVLNQVA